MPPAGPRREGGATWTIDRARTNRKHRASAPPDRPGRPRRAPRRCPRRRPRRLAPASNRSAGGAPVDWQAVGAAAPTTRGAGLVYAGWPSSSPCSSLVLTIFRAASHQRSVRRGDAGDGPEAPRRCPSSRRATATSRPTSGPTRSARRSPSRASRASATPNCSRYWQLTNKMIASAIRRSAAGSSSRPRARRTRGVPPGRSTSSLVPAAPRGHDARVPGRPAGRPGPAGAVERGADHARSSPSRCRWGGDHRRGHEADRQVRQRCRRLHGRPGVPGAVLQLGEPDRTVITRYMTAPSWHQADAEPAGPAGISADGGRPRPRTRRRSRDRRRARPSIARGPPGSVPARSPTGKRGDHRRTSHRPPDRISPRCSVIRQSRPTIACAAVAPRADEQLPAGRSRARGRATASRPGSPRHWRPPPPRRSGCRRRDFP